MANLDVTELEDTLPQRNEEYETREYWDERYSREPEEKTFDWFKTYDQISSHILELIPDKSARILILGCGNSKLSAEMYDDGYTNIVNIDFSGVVINKMKGINQDIRPLMEWHVMDIRQLSFSAHSFDVAIDKGTMDAMMTAKGDVWDPPEHVVENCTKEIDEVLRVLNANGKFLYLTFGQPHFRRRFLSRPGTELDIRILGDMFHYYLYILKK